MEYKTYALGQVLLQSGITLRNATLAYQTYGELNDDRSNAIIFPTSYSSLIHENEWLIGEGMSLDEYWLLWGPWVVRYRAEPQKRDWRRWAPVPVWVSTT